MLRKFLNVKLHGLVVTGKDINYQGSLTIDENIMKQAGLKPYESVLVVNINNGSRFETYLIPGDKSQVILNGGAARLGEIGDKLIVLAFIYLNENELPSFKPKIILFNEKNEIVEIREINL
ncbi:MAG: aspartate 1-decarboxylase [Candidatus Njordarchaeum guaymaensis]